MIHALSTIILAQESTLCTVASAHLGEDVLVTL